MHRQAINVRKRGRIVATGTLVRQVAEMNVNMTTGTIITIDISKFELEIEVATDAFSHLV